MYRLIFYVIALILSLLLPDSRIRSIYPGRRYNRYYRLFEDEGDYGMSVGENNNTLADRIRAGIRRSKALKKSKKFVSKDKYIITLKNKSVILVMDTKNKTLSCVDNKVKGRAATVSWNEHPISQLGKIDNTFEQTFDSICVSFDENANYKGILNILKQHFDVHENDPKPTTPRPAAIIEEEDAPIKLTSKYTKVVDINSADEKEIAKLPGISIILAKRIIKYRELNNGFKNAEEFYREFKIKPHFQKKLEPQISFNPIKKKGKKSADERIIDF